MENGCLTPTAFKPPNFNAKPKQLTHRHTGRCATSPGTPLSPVNVDNLDNCKNKCNSQQFLMLKMRYNEVLFGLSTTQYILCFMSVCVCVCAVEQKSSSPYSICLFIHCFIHTTMIACQIHVYFLSN